MPDVMLSCPVTHSCRSLLWCHIVVCYECIHTTASLCVSQIVMCSLWMYTRLSYYVCQVILSCVVMDGCHIFLFLLYFTRLGCCLFSKRALYVSSCCPVYEHGCVCVVSYMVVCNYTAVTLCNTHNYTMCMHHVILPCVVMNIVTWLCMCHAVMCNYECRRTAAVVLSRCYVIYS